MMLIKIRRERDSYIEFFAFKLMSKNLCFNKTFGFFVGICNKLKNYNFGYR